ncbi:Pregnancy-associated glycoprotein 4 [Clonorchis sinensis]|uniref:Pregnancy-associated glycoprotein 4 n=1 Tax=Clonorchis sinensis TaxID=79923 RepID=A0A8T1MUI2_CLOSI|nr:Pregnancy-associated glycoprotein 4 [Clonorchis sinensis]
MEIAVGTPGQYLNVEVDTSFGTSLIVAAERMHRVEYVLYNVTASTTAEVEPTWVCTNFESHRLEGRKAADVLRIGEYNLRKAHFQMIEYTRSRPSFLHQFSGKLGLAPLSQVTTESFAQSLVRLLPEPVFTMWFHPDEDGVYRRGIFSFGGIHGYRYDEPLVYVPLVPINNSWMVQATKISIGPHVICQQDCNIHFNTAQHYFYGPADKIDDLHRLAHLSPRRDRSGIYRIDCGGEATHPLFIVQFGDVEFQWRISDLWNKRMLGRRIVCLSGMRDSTSQTEWVFGHKVMRKLFTVFDWKNARMGLAKASRP